MEDINDYDKDFSIDDINKTIEELKKQVINNTKWFPPNGNSGRKLLTINRIKRIDKAIYNRFIKLFIKENNINGHINSYDIWNNAYWGTKENCSKTIMEWEVQNYISLWHLNFYDWIEENEEFDFLYFAKKLGGKTGIELSKKYIFQWYTLFKHKVNFPWSDELIAKRLINILYNYEFINSLSSKYETDYLNKIIYIHVKRLFYEFKKKSEFDLTSDELKAVSLFSLILNKNDLKFLKKIEAVLDVQIDALGVHKSYNLLEHAKFINNINEIISKYSNIDIFINNKNIISKASTIIDFTQNPYKVIRRGDGDYKV